MRYFLLLLITNVTLLACTSESSNTALGTLERERIAHTATTSEVIISLPKTQGSRVKKGDVLVQLDNSLQIAQIQRTEAEVAQAQASLDKLRIGAREEELAAARATVSAAKAATIEAQSNYLRSQKLHQQNVISKAELDKIKAERDESLANLQKAQEKFRELTNGTREEDLRAAEAHLAAAQASLASEEIKLKELTITATRDGILDSLPWNLGERVTQGSPLAIVLAGESPFARIYTPEPYRVKIKIGQKLKVHIDGISDPLTGTVRWISSEPAFTPYYALNQEERARLVYLTEIQLPDSTSHIASGIPVQVEMP